MNPMSGVSIMLADVISILFSPIEVVFMWLTIYAISFGPSLLIIAGLILSFFRRRRRLAVALAIMGSSGYLLLMLVAGMERMLLRWDAGTIYVKTLLVLGITTIGRVYYLHRKEKKQQHREARGAVEGCTTKPREL